VKHICMVSGGEGSAYTAALVQRTYGIDWLLFADTLAEDTDAYRFLIESSFFTLGLATPVSLLARVKKLPEWHEDRFGRRPVLAEIASEAMALAPQLRWISLGLDPWEIYKRDRFLGNSSVDPCSKHLKRTLVDRWAAKNCDPPDTTIYVGIDFTESHRFDDGKGGGLGPRKLADGWRYAAPMCEPPFHSRRDAVVWLQGAHISRPRLTLAGFSHNNCSTSCCKGGQGHRAHQLRTYPARYAFDEKLEEDMRDFLGKDVSMLTDRTGDGVKKPLTLKELRERIEAGRQVDLFDIGGCGCFIAG
jgi:hypothetical protein